MNAGTLQISGAGTLGNTGSATTINGGTLDLGGTTQTQNGGLTLTGGTLQNGTLSSSGTFDVQAGSVSAALAGTGALAKTGAGTVTLSSANSVFRRHDRQCRHVADFGRRHARQHRRCDHDQRRCARSRRHDADAERRSHPAGGRTRTARCRRRHLRYAGGHGQRSARRHRRWQDDRWYGDVLGRQHYTGNTSITNGTLALTGAARSARSQCVTVNGATAILTGGTTQTRTAGSRCRPAAPSRTGRCRQPPRSTCSRAPSARRSLDRRPHQVGHQHGDAVRH